MITDYDTYLAKTAARMQRERELLDGKLPCPFCGSRDLSIADCWDDDNVILAVVCLSCKAEAPADVWNRREIS